MSAGPEPGLSVDEVFLGQFPIHRACRDGDVGALVTLFEHLSNQPHLTVEDSCYGWTPMHWAAYYGHLECVMRLVQLGCEVNKVTSRFNQTPMHTAAFGGHPHCVVWLTQAGADVNTQDFVGEAPIHKASRSGSLECVQVLLIAGAKPHLRNASGQTAADLAQAHGFHDCFSFISESQFRGNVVNGGQNGNSTLCGHVVSRKRLPNAEDTGHTKKARRIDNLLVQLQHGGGEELETMDITSTLELNSDETKLPNNDLHHTLPFADLDEPQPAKTLSSLPANQQAVASTHQSFADMCGSLHLTGSPSSCVSHRPAWCGLTGADCEDLHYGHYHGFGDTAEELSDSSIQAKNRHNQAVASSIHLHKGS